MQIAMFRNLPVQTCLLMNNPYQVISGMADAINICFIYLVLKHSYQGLVKNLDGNEIKKKYKYKLIF